MNSGSVADTATEIGFPSSSLCSSLVTLLRPFSSPRKRLLLPFKTQRRARILVSGPLKCSAEDSILPLPSKSRNSNACFAVLDTAAGVTDVPQAKLRRLVEEFRSLVEPIDRVKRLLDYASLLPWFPDSDRKPSNRVAGCTVQVWLSVDMAADGRMRFSADSDSEITKGFCACLIWALDGASPEEILGLNTEDISELNVGLPGRAPSRANAWLNVLISMQKRTAAIATERSGKPPHESFPSLLLTTDELIANGGYAGAQVSELAGYV